MLNDPQSLVTEVVPTDSVAKPHIQLPKYGYTLAIFILCIISGYLVFLYLYVGFKNLDAVDNIVLPLENLSDSAFSRKMSLIEVVQQEKKNDRDFLLHIRSCLVF